jgi:hypothetical protein
MKTLMIVTNEQTPCFQFPVLTSTHYCKHIYYGKMGRKFISRIVKHLTHRSIGPAHHPFHSECSAKKMAFVDPLSTAGTDQHILVIVGHPGNLMGHHLSDRQYKIMPSLNKQSVDLGRPGVVNPLLIPHLKSCLAPHQVLPHRSSIYVP